MLNMMLNMNNQQQKWHREYEVAMCEKGGGERRIRTKEGGAGWVFD